MRQLMAAAFASCMVAAPAMGARVIRMEDDFPSPDDSGLRERRSAPAARRTDRVQGREITRTGDRERARHLRQAARRAEKQARQG